MHRGPCHFSWKFLGSFLEKPVSSFYFHISVLEAHSALPGAGPPQEHPALAAHAVAAALTHGAPVQQEPQRLPAAGTGLLFVLLAHALRAFPPEMLQACLQFPYPLCLRVLNLPVPVQNLEDHFAFRFLEGTEADLVGHFHLFSDPRCSSTPWPWAPVPEELRVQQQPQVLLKALPLLFHWQRCCS